ncbi:MAG TPA: hypothetical protein VJA64_03680 [Desulfobaccales bacterium]|nr:hypothetical protein [Desulfobaccales bacterium]
MPGDDFTAFGFIIQHYFAAPRPWGQGHPGRIAFLGKEFLRMEQFGLDRLLEKSYDLKLRE